MGMDAYSSFGDKLFELLASHAVLDKVLQEGKEGTSGNGVDVDVADEHFAYGRYCRYVVGKVYMSIVRIGQQDN